MASQFEGPRAVRTWEPPVIWVDVSFESSVLPIDRADAEFQLGRLQKKGHGPRLDAGRRVTQGTAQLLEGWIDV